MVSHVAEGAGGALTSSAYTLLFPLLASAVLTDPHAIKQPAAAAFALVKKHCGATMGGAIGVHARALHRDDVSRISSYRVLLEEAPDMMLGGGRGERARMSWSSPTRDSASFPPLSPNLCLSFTAFMIKAAL